MILRLMSNDMKKRGKWDGRLIYFDYLCSINKKV